MKRFPKYKSEINAFGKALRRIRKEKGISAEELALEAELDRGTVHYIETGKAVASLHTIFAVSEALKVDPRVFFEFLDKK